MSDGGGRVALVGGAAGELGAAIARALEDRGWRVAGLDRRESACRRSVVVELCDREAVRREVEALRNELGEIFCLVSASISHESLPLSDVSHELWRETLKSHLLSAANLCWAALPAMLEAGRGNIVTLSSDTALGAPATGVHSAAAAGALIGFTKALAIEVAPSGVQVNCVATSLQVADAATSPLGRAVRPEEVAATVSYLAEQPHFFTGQVLCPDGGEVI